MSWRGNASLTLTRPKAVAECDRCGFITNREKLQPQLRYAGASIIDTGWRVCRDCVDPLDPQEKLTIPLPDGLPIPDPRPWTRTTTEYTPPATSAGEAIGLLLSLTKAS